jgi:hypothetical protein
MILGANFLAERIAAGGCPLPIPALAPRRHRSPGSSMAWCASGFPDPEGWQIVAGGRNAMETPGSGFVGPCILEGCENSATPSGSMGNFGTRSGGVAPASASLRRGKSLDPRLPSGKPPACSDTSEDERRLHWTAGILRVGSFLPGSGVVALPRRHSACQPNMRAQRTRIKALEGRHVIAPGKRSAARGYGREMISSFFPSGLPRMFSGQTGRKKRGWIGWSFTPGGGIGSLAQGYYLAAPEGRWKCEDAPTNGAIAILLHARRLGRAVPQPRHSPTT